MVENLSVTRPLVRALNTIGNSEHKRVSGGSATLLLALSEAIAKITAIHTNRAFEQGLHSKRLVRVRSMRNGHRSRPV
jgi:hypothetical protein